ncbi:TetR/AcrR family transcriptional regulator [Sporichthya brevicatena]|uniref:TetR/AcrR family transcriptional regulator n=1 Tax=Sporichthya brevicatena TaxID=171442 RepID=A0ABN1HA34_9ACTN
MSPKAADPSVRTALLEAAARQIATGGSGSLTLRRLVDEVGTSTMAVYTHFGGMQNLRQEVRREGFARLREHLESVTPTRNPLADLVRAGWEYYDNAVENPHLYRVMFLDHHEPADDTIGLDTFDRLVQLVARCVEGGQLAAGDPFDLAVQLWAALHGVVSLQLSGLLAPDLALEMVASSWRTLFLGFGAEPRTVTRALQAHPRRTPRAARDLGSGG